MRTNKAILGLSACATLILFSCKKEGTNSPGIAYQLKTSNSTALTTGRVLGGSLNWTSGYASAVEIEFEAEKAGLELEYKNEAKQKIDLFFPLSTLGVISVPAGTYDDIEFEVELQPNGPDAAFYLSGSYTSASGVRTPVTFKLNATLELEAEKSNITIADGASLNALTTLNLSMLSNGVTETMFNNASKTNGVIEISATSNTGIYEIIYNNLRNCSGVEVD